jgi:hypothetical protein
LSWLFVGSTSLPVDNLFRVLQFASAALYSLCAAATQQPASAEPGVLPRLKKRAFCGGIRAAVPRMSTVSMPRPRSFASRLVTSNLLHARHNPLELEAALVRGVIVYSRWRSLSKNRRPASDSNVTCRILPHSFIQNVQRALGIVCDPDHVRSICQEQLDFEFAWGAGLHGRPTGPAELST